MYDWFTHLGLGNVRRFEYRGTGSNSPLELIRHPLSTVHAEILRRRLIREVNSSTLLLSRELSPLSQGANERRLLQSAARGVYDFDDAMYSTLPGAVGKLYSRAHVWRKCVMAADIVIAGSESLAERANLVNPNVVMVPSCVEHTRYLQKTSYETIGNPVAVWIGSPAAEPYLQLAAESLLKVHQDTGLRLRVISSGSRSLGKLDAMVDRLTWSPSTFASDLATADFGIMPLPDNEWTRGKCAYKLLQYGAAGLPVIGSPVGANVKALEHLGGFSPRNQDEWADALRDIIDSSAADRADKGREARSAVVSHYSFTAWRDTWSRALGIHVP